MKPYKHLGSQERERIEIWLEGAKSMRWIGKRLGRAPSTISRECRKNTVKGIYDSDKASVKAYQRLHAKMKMTKKIRWFTQLEYLIRSLLRTGYTPEKVSMRLAEEYCYCLSGSTIRRYITSKYAYDLKMSLQEQNMLKKYKKKWREKWSRILYRTMIDVRPLYISSPFTTWHYECDFIESVKGDKTVILRLIDKHSRFRIAIKLPDKSSQRVYKALKYCIKKYGIRSITFDNDLSFAKHYQLGILTYFCHAYSSWEKWLVERSHKQYRIPRPKWTILKNISQGEIDELTLRVNHLPMKCLHRKTPYEVHYNTILRYLPTNVNLLH